MAKRNTIRKVIGKGSSPTRYLVQGTYWLPTKAKAREFQKYLKKHK